VWLTDIPQIAKPSNSREMKNGSESDRRASTLLMWALTLAGVGLNLAFTIQPLANTSVEFNFNGGFYSFNYSPYVYAGFLLMPLFYCTILSLATKPKRLVSPLNIQLITVLAGTMTLTFAFIGRVLAGQPTLITDPTFAEYFVLEAVVIFFLLGVLGIAQTVAVRWIVGLNFVDAERTTFLVNWNVDAFEKAIDKEIRYARGFDEVKGETGIKILRTKYATGETIVLGYGQNPTGDGTVLSVVASDHSFYEMYVSPEAKWRRDSILRDIRQKLEDQDPKTTFKEAPTDDPISVAAYVLARRPTETKIAFTRRALRPIPHYYIYAILLSIAALVGTTVLYAEGIGHLSLGEYLGVAFFVGITLIVEIGLALRTEIQIQRRPP
jgi:hypothetical protein